MLKELALLVTLLTLLTDARPQRFEEPLNDQDEMSEEVDINGPQRFDNGDLLDNNDEIRDNSDVSIKYVAFPIAPYRDYLFIAAMDIITNNAESEYQ
ncbi:hypothetical protein EMCRGX_G000272 [Ephydatia muelleri]